MSLNKRYFNLTLYEIIDTNLLIDFDNLIDESDLLSYAHKGSIVSVHKLI